MGNYFTPLRQQLKRSNEVPFGYNQIVSQFAADLMNTVMYTEVADAVRVI